METRRLTKAEKVCYYGLVAAIYGCPLWAVILRMLGGALK
jgi:hypothetical protein